MASSVPAEFDPRYMFFDRKGVLWCGTSKRDRAKERAVIAALEEETEGSHGGGESQRPRSASAARRSSLPGRRRASFRAHKPVRGGADLTEDGSEWFIISAPWVRSWLYFTEGGQREAPGPVDNMILLQERADGVLIPRTDRALDARGRQGHFRLVKGRVWRKFCELYPGSGPWIRYDNDALKTTAEERAALQARGFDLPSLPWRVQQDFSAPAREKTDWELDEERVTFQSIVEKVTADDLEREYAICGAAGAASGEEAGRSSASRA